MKVLVYATHLSERERKKVARLLPSAKPGGRPRKHARRLLCDAIFYLVRAGCAWHLLPCNFPPWKTVHHYFPGVALGRRVAAPARTAAEPL